MLYIFYFRNFNTLKSSFFPSLSLSLFHSTTPLISLFYCAVFAHFSFCVVSSFIDLVNRALSVCVCFFATRQRNELNVHF